MRSRPEKGNAPEVAATEASNEVTQVLTQGFNMADSTQTSANRAITVPFRGADLYVVEHNGQPYTPMKPIVEGMGLAWQPQHRKLAANESRWGITIMVMPLQGVSDSETPPGGAQKMLVMPLRKLPGWLATIDPGRVKNEDARAKVVEYQNECDDVLWQYWNEGIVINPRAAYSVNSGDVLTKEEADTLRQMVEGMAKKLTSDTKVQGKFIMQAWSKLKAHFHVSYREIPRQELTEAISIVNRHTVEWELVDEVPKLAHQPTVPEIVADWVEKIEQPNGYPAMLFMPLVNAVLRKQGFNLALSAGPAPDLLPEAQAKEITERLNRLGKLFHPFSDQFNDVMGVLRALRGMHPAAGMPEPGYRQLLPRLA